MTKETKFVIFCLENYKVHRALKGKQAADLFRQYGVYEYLREFYDVLHTTGYQYINQDIDRYLEAREVVFPGA